MKTITPRIFVGLCLVVGFVVALGCHDLLTNNGAGVGRVLGLLGGRTLAWLIGG